MSYEYTITLTVRSDDEPIDLAHILDAAHRSGLACVVECALFAQGLDVECINEDVVVEEVPPPAEQDKADAT
jgi:hypothetical protein